MINGLWILAIVFAVGYGSIPGLLGILCLFVMDGVLELKGLRIHANTIATVFGVESQPMTEEHAEAMTEGVMERVRAEMLAQSTRRPH